MNVFFTNNLYNTFTSNLKLGQNCILMIKYTKIFMRLNKKTKFIYILDKQENKCTHKLLEFLILKLNAFT